MIGEVSHHKIFPSTIYTMYLHDDISNFFYKIVEEVDFKTVGDNPHWVSKFNLLDDYSEVKEMFTNIVLKILNEVSGVEKIKITTSWLTAIEPNATPTLHRHQNSWFSGVYYFQNSYSGLQFKNPIERDIDLKNGKLTGNWRLQPEKNRLVIFPSYLYHKIEKNTSDEVRHSLAFNVMPDGTIGKVDSEFIY
tara:strand:+ start:44 stop:619 length:576 start_codon:yes stop_codon:yes gene_type:complete